MQTAQTSIAHANCCHIRIISYDAALRVYTVFGAGQTISLQKSCCGVYYSRFLCSVLESSGPLMKER